MAKDYIVKVRAEADTTKLDKQLQYYARNNKTKIQVKVEADEKVLDKLHEKYKLIDDDFKKIKQDVKTAFSHTDDSGITKSVDKVTETFKNASGEVQKLITYIEHYKGKHKVLSSVVESSTKTFAGFNNSLDQTAKKSQTIEKVVNKYRSLTGILHTITEETLANGQKIRTFVSEYEKGGQKIRETSKMISDETGKNWKKYDADLKEVINDETKLTETHKKLQKVYSETNTYRRNDGAIVNRTYSKDSDGTQYQKLIIEYEDKKGRKIQETTELIKLQGENWKQNGETSKTVIDDEIAREEQLFNSIQRVYEETVKYKNAQGQTVTRTNTIDSDGTRHHLITKEYEDSLGRKIQEVTEYIKIQGQGWKQNGETSTKVIDDEIAREERQAEVLRRIAEERERANSQIRNTVVTNNSYKKVIDGVTHSITEQKTQTEAENGVLNEVTVTTDKYRDVLGRTITKTTTLDQNMKQTTSTMIEMGKQTRHLGQRFSDIIVKVTKFYLASLPVRAVQSAITSTVQAVKEFDSALTEFKKVSNLSGESLDEYCKKLETLGELTARTRTEMVQMATEFKRSGFSDEDSAHLAKISSLYQNIADEELSAADASAVLISQIKAFQNQGLEAEEVIDSINEVANKNAVSSGDIGRGLTQAGAALSTYGNTFYETIGLITAGTEINFGKSPNSLN